MSAGKLGPQDVITASPSDSIETVASRLGSENVGAVVITEDNKPVGMITDRDIALSVGEHDDLADQSADQIMTSDPVTIREDEDAMAISQKIGDAHIRRLPIVDDGGELTGIVTLDDLVATIGEQLENVADVIESQSPEYRP